MSLSILQSAEIMAVPNRFVNSVYDTCPDDDSMKVVYLQAAGKMYEHGDRHVLLWWMNATSEDSGSPVTQIVELSGQAGNYNHYAPVAKSQSQLSFDSNLQISLGEFNRVQRDQILQLAKDIKFNKTSVTNGCRVWTRDLLEAMIGVGFITQETFARLDADIPLVRRREEAMGLITYETFADVDAAIPLVQRCAEA